MTQIDEQKVEEAVGELTESLKAVWRLPAPPPRHIRTILDALEAKEQENTKLREELAAAREDERRLRREACYGF